MSANQVSQQQPENQKKRNFLKTNNLNATLRVSLSPIRFRLDLVISYKQALSFA